jgi:uncharacterized membrane protein (DUF373 family)
MPDRKPVSRIRDLKDLKLLASLDGFKRVLIFAITFMMGLVLLLATIDLGYYLYLNVVDAPPYFLLSVKEILDLFGIFLLVLIGIELFETLEIYIKENVIHIEVVLTVALIALARKVIILDVNKFESGTLFAIASLILALSIGYYLVRRAFQFDVGEKSGNVE